MLEHVTNLGSILAPGTASRPVLLDLGGRGVSRRSFTREQFDAQCDAVAMGLLETGLSPDQRVGLMSANRAEFLIAYSGIMRAGMIAVPLNHRLPLDTLSQLMAETDLGLCFCDKEREKVSKESGRTICFDDPEWEALCSNTTSFQSATPTPETIAKILFTSGSTGLPKGVPLSHGGQLWALRQYVDTPVPTGEKTLNVAPFYHKNGLFLSTVALASGSLVVTMPRFDAPAYLRAIDKYQVTNLSGVPTMFSLLAKETALLESLDLSCVSNVLMGSAPLSDTLVEQVQRMFPEAKITNGYGITEAGPAIFGAHPKGLKRPVMSVGYPLREVSWRLVNGDEKRGTLLVKTPAMTSGYYKRAELNASKFVEDGWYDTGDILRRDDNGFFFFVGRADDMFVCSGENVYPREVERLLEQHPAVAQAIVVAAPDSIRGAVPAAFVVKSESVDLQCEELKKFALANGPSYQYPRYIEIIETVPLATTNKIDLEPLRSLAEHFAKSAGRYTDE